MVLIKPGVTCGDDILADIVITEARSAMEEVRSPNLVREKQTLNKRKADFHPHRPPHPPPPSSNGYGAPPASGYGAPPAPSYSAPAPAPSYGAPTTPAPSTTAGYDHGEIDLHKKEFCVDVSTYQPVVWVERNGQECKTGWVKQCSDRSENVCIDVTETVCEVSW